MQPRGFRLSLSAWRRMGSSAAEPWEEGWGSWRSVKFKSPMRANLTEIGKCRRKSHREQESGRKSIWRGEIPLYQDSTFRRKIMFLVLWFSVVWEGGRFRWSEKCGIVWRIEFGGGRSKDEFQGGPQNLGRRNSSDYGTGSGNHGSHHCMEPPRGSSDWIERGLFGTGWSGGSEDKLWGPVAELPASKGLHTIRSISAS